MSQNGLKDSLLIAIKKSFIKMNETLDLDYQRSSKKVDEIHALIASHLQSHDTSKKYEVISKKIDGSESTVLGKFYNKKVDIEIIEKDSKKTVAIIEFKLRTASLLKNQRNSIENMFGFTYNIRSNDIKVFWIYCVPKWSPDYTKNDDIKTFYEWKERDNETLYKMYDNKIDIQNELAVPNGFLLNIFDLNYSKNAKNKKDIIKEVTSLEEFNKLNIQYEDDVYINNGLFINSYDNFIDFIWKEIYNER